MSARWKGIVFDLDGTLIDTEKLYRRFWVEAARQMGYPMEERHALMIRAMAASIAGPLLRREVCPEFDYEGVRSLRRKLMEEYVDVHGVQAMPGMIPLLDAVHARGMRIALATATQEARARSICAWCRRRRILTRWSPRIRCPVEACARYLRIGREAPGACATGSDGCGGCALRRSLCT